MKSARHSLILELIDSFDVETQDELAEKLKQEDVVVTQATISRDIKELRLIKVLTDGGKYKYATADKAEIGMRDKFRRIFAHSVLAVTSTGNLIVVKTLSGSASGATEAIDSFHWNEIAGTIAGDNTIFIAVKDPKSAPELVKRLYDMMERE
ncbi:MAG: arginine repressor [Clostridia bacterium]